MESFLYCLRLLALVEFLRCKNFLLWFQLNDVGSGGRTVFPRIGAGVSPVAGSAVFWYNLFESGSPDRLTLHGACPVLYGAKWGRIMSPTCKASFLISSFSFQCPISGFARELSSLIGPADSNQKINMISNEKKITRITYLSICDIYPRSNLANKFVRKYKIFTMIFFTDRGICRPFYAALAICCMYVVH